MARARYYLFMCIKGLSKTSAPLARLNCRRKETEQVPELDIRLSVREFFCRPHPTAARTGDNLLIFLRSLRFLWPTVPSRERSETPSPARHQSDRAGHADR